MPAQIFPSVIFKSEWSKITNKKNDVAEIDIDGIIGGDFWEEDNDKSANTMAKMKAELKAISELKASRIIVNINSPGGSVAHGLSIHDLLALHPAKVTTRINGMTASIATVIAMAGDEIEMSDNALFLIHRAKYGLLGMFNQNNLEGVVENLETIDNKIVNIYQKRTGIAEKILNELMDKDEGSGVWLTANEAKEYGFITSIFEPMKMAALYANEDILKRFKLPDLPINNTDMDNKTLFENLKSFVAELFTKKEEDKEDVLEIPKEVTDKITEFETSLTALEGENETLKVEFEALKVANDKLKADKEAELTALNAKISGLETDLVKANAKSTVIPGIIGQEDTEMKIDPEVAMWETEAQKIKDEFKERTDESPDLDAKLKTVL